MLYLFVPENQEISAITRQLKLTGIRCAVPFDVYRGDAALLCRTPVRPAGTATAVSSLLTAFPPAPQDLLVSLGEGQPLRQDVPFHWVLCTGIRGSSFSWYPDLLFAHPFSEGGLVPEPSCHDHDPDLMFYEPCALSFAESAGYFASPHQIIMLRCRDFHTGLLPEMLTPLLNWCIRTDALSAPVSHGLTETEQAEVTQLAAQMRLSHTMTLRLSQLFLFHKLQSGGLWNGLEDLRQAYHDLPCPSKAEGKKQFEQLRESILL